MDLTLDLERLLGFNATTFLVKLSHREGDSVSKENALYCKFVNNSLCGSPKAVFLQDPFTFSAYPTAQRGARVRLDSPSRNWTIMGAVYDGDPELKGGDPTDNGDNQHGTSFELGDNGVVWALETHYHRNRFSREALPGVFELGGYYMTGDFRRIGVAYGTYTFFAVLSFFFLWALVKETKGKELEEM